MEIRVFKAENNKHNKTYYAVTGAENEDKAVRAVIKHKKANFSKTYYDYVVWRGVIAPYKDGLDGLWKAKDRKDGKSCYIVFKE